MKPREEKKYKGNPIGGRSKTVQSINAEVRKLILLLSSTYHK